MKTATKNTKENGKHISIKLKLLGIIIPVVAIAVVALLISTYSRTNEIITGYAMKSLRTASEAGANQIASFVTEVLSELNAFKVTLEKGGFDAEEEKAFLKGTSGYDDCIPDGIYIGDGNEGFITAADWPLPDDFTITDRAWYQEGLENEEFQFGTAYFDTNKNTFVVTASARLDGRDAAVPRVAGADVYLSHVSEMISNIRIMGAGQCFLLDRKTNMIIAHPDAEMAGKTLGDPEQGEFYKNISEYISSGKEDSSILKGEDGRFIVGNAPVEGSNWTLVSFVPKNIFLSQLKQFQNFLILITILIIVALAVLTERVVHIIIRPVKRLTATIAQITDGDFTVDITSGGNDEVAVMSTSLRRFISVMRDTVSDVSRISGHLNEQAVLSSDISEELYTASSQQAASMQELDHTVEQLVKANSEIAENATALAGIAAGVRENGKNVSGQMQETVAVSDKGKKDMDNVDQAMERIQASVESLEDTVSEVGKATEQITDFVQLIGSIANQTNMLSLNASIEAARSGEAGRGFAVVADQIGQLADDSAKSVKEIAGLTRNINELVKNTIEKTQGSVAEIKTSGKLVKETQSTFHSIYDTILQTNEVMQDMVSKINEVDEVAASMAAITEQQAAGAEEILATSAELTSDAKRVTENGESVAKNASELAKTSEELSEHMKQFRLE